MIVESTSFIEWLLNGLVIIGMSIIGWWTRNMDGRMGAYDSNQIRLMERSATLEAHYNDIQSRLERIERKVDRLNGTH